MAKSKKTKAKQKDFQKIKLKVGKKLKKPQDTDTRFQSRKIVLSDQLGKYCQPDASSSLPFNQQSLSLVELCKNARHHNNNVRKDSLRSLHSKLESDLNSIRHNLALLISSLSPLFHSECSSQVRNELRSVLKLIYKEAKTEDMKPHFQLLISHILCGLSSLEGELKLFALEVLENTVITYSALCKTNKDLLNAFLDFLADVGENKLTSFFSTKRQKLSILRILHEVTCVLLTPKGTETTCLSEQERDERTVKFDVKDPSSAFIRIQNYSGIHVSPFDFPFIYPDMGAEADKTVLNSPSQMERYFTVSFQYLNKIWTELQVQNRFTESSDFTLNEKLYALNGILETQCRILDAVKEQLSSASAFLALESLNKAIRRVLGKKTFIQSYTSVFPIKIKDVGPLNYLLATFLISASSFLSPELQRSWFDLDLCNEVLFKYRMRKMRPAHHDHDQLRIAEKLLL